ncbi:MAG: hypothetical protein WCO18_00085, partial [bacterium]
PKFLAVVLMGVASIWHGMFGTHAPINSNSQYGGMYGSNSQNRPVNQNGSSMLGTVSNINNTTLTIQSLQRSNNTSASTTSVDFTVDTSNARIIKAGSTTTATIANIAVGDKVIVQGTINGNSITAKLVIDTLPPSQIQNQPQKTTTSTQAAKPKVAPKTPAKKK